MLRYSLPQRSDRRGRASSPEAYGTARDLAGPLFRGGHRGEAVVVFVTAVCIAADAVRYVGSALRRGLAGVNDP
ncbi:hypothetical protein Ari01nite_90300 [Paractinoplanes rishiriensis]|uniref:Uncharacterized protein n=1 Tax=Paractinoplanes rishiriensis TaxID=1050105 RepID=A0A919K630_9ACTN|nr:hypothetical protein Ari01nite_90300 [Actinoplanes rishiriensis]